MGKPLHNLLFSINILTGCKIILAWLQYDISERSWWHKHLFRMTQISLWQSPLIFAHKNLLSFSQKTHYGLMPWISLHSVCKSFLRTCCNFLMEFQSGLCKVELSCWSGQWLSMWAEGEINCVRKGKQSVWRAAWATKVFSQIKCTSKCSSASSPFILTTIY